MLKPHFVGVFYVFSAGYFCLGSIIQSCPEHPYNAQSDQRLINHSQKNDDTAEEIPYYLKRFLMKQILNNYSTSIARVESFRSGSLGGDFLFLR